jgi:hypothetical protein
MATENALFNTSSPFTVSSGACTITSGNLAISNYLRLTSISSTVGKILLNGNRFFHNAGLGKTICIGNLACPNSISYDNSVVIGSNAHTNGIGDNQVAVGYYALNNNSSGIYCTTFGYYAGKNSSNTNYLIALGASAGTSIGSSGNDNCICLANVGVNGKANVMYLGTQGSGNGQQQDCYIAGIYSPGHALAGTQKVVTIDSNATGGKAGGLAGAVGTIFIGGTQPTFLAAGSTGQTLKATTSSAVSWTGSPSWTGAVSGTSFTATTGGVTATAGGLTATDGGLTVSLEL